MKTVTNEEMEPLTYQSDDKVHRPRLLDIEKSDTNFDNALSLTTENINLRQNHPPLTNTHHAKEIHFNHQNSQQYANHHSLKHYSANNRKDEDQQEDLKLYHKYFGKKASSGIKT